MQHKTCIYLHNKTSLEGKNEPDTFFYQAKSWKLASCAPFCITLPEVLHQPRSNLIEKKKKKILFFSHNKTNTESSYCCILQNFHNYSMFSIYYNQKKKNHSDGEEEKTLVLWYQQKGIKYLISHVFRQNVTFYLVVSGMPRSILVFKRQGKTWHLDKQRGS